MKEEIKYEYSADGQIHDATRLKELQALPLWRKIQITQARIIEWYQHYDGQVYISFSGGKDSAVLLDLARRIYPDIEGVFVDTGLEYSQIRDFVKTFDNITWLKPEMRFDEVIKTYGYPIITKEVSRDVGRVQKNSGWNSRTGERTMSWKLLHDEVFDKNGKPSIYNKGKWMFLCNAPFKISNDCCDIMKKKPLHNYDKQTGKVPITAVMATESKMRKKEWLKTGCNAFDNNNPQSKPMSFWTENDVLEYIDTYKIPICSVYGDVVNDGNGNYETTGERRTGCVFCGFGCHLEKTPNRYERLKGIDRQKWEYCMRPIEENGLGMGAVLDYINVKWGKEE